MIDQYVTTKVSDTINPAFKPHLVVPKLPTIPVPTGDNTVKVLTLIQQVVNVLSSSSVTKQELVNLNLVSVAGDPSTAAAYNQSLVLTKVQVPQTTNSETLSTFAASLAQLTVVDVLPTLPNDLYPVGSFVIFVVDGKLYRNIAGSWSAAVSAADVSANDDVLTPTQKPEIVKSVNSILAEQAGLDAQATAAELFTEQATYDSAITTLTNYLATLTTPVHWDDLTGNTTLT